MKQSFNITCKNILKSSAKLVSIISLFGAVLGLRAQASEFSFLAKSLASPTYFSQDEADKGRTDSKIMLQMEESRQLLAHSAMNNSSLESARQTILSELDNVHYSMEKIHELDKRVPDYGGLVENALIASPGLYDSYNNRPLSGSESDAVDKLEAKIIVEGVKWVWNGIQAAYERDNYHSYFEKARRTAFTELGKTLPSVYPSSRQLADSSPLTVDVDGSWNNTFTTDSVRVRNGTGKTLRNCALFVNLEGANARSGQAESDDHLHYVGIWQPGQWLYLEYPSSSAAGIATDESVGCLRTVKLYCVSDDYNFHYTYDYSGAAYDADVKRYFEQALKPAFHGQFTKDKDRFLGLGGDGLWELSFDGKLSSFPVSAVTVTLEQGSDQKAIRWTMNHGHGTFQSGVFGTEKFSDPGFNGWNPDKVTVKLEFPFSSYTSEMYWNLR